MSFPRAAISALIVGWRLPPGRRPGAPVLLSSDPYRYLWDGRVQRSGINPYGHTPADEALRPLRDPEIHPQINRPTQPTVYPPGAEIMFWLVAAVAPDSLLAWRLFVLAAEIATGTLLLGLLRRLRVAPSALLVYAWAPLAVFEGVQAGHVDVGCFPSCSWRWAGGRPADSCAPASRSAWRFSSSSTPPCCCSPGGAGATGSCLRRAAP